MSDDYSRDVWHPTGAPPPPLASDSYDWSDPSLADDIATEAAREDTAERQAFIAAREEVNRSRAAAPPPRIGVPEGGMGGAIGRMSEALFGKPDPEVVARYRRAARRAEHVAIAQAAQQYLIAAALAIVCVLLLVIGWRIL